MALTLDKLKASVKSFQDKKNENSGDFPKATFLPEGTHKGRFLTDPTDEFMVDYWAFGYFNRGIRDPDSIPATEKPEGFVNTLKQFYEEKFKPMNLWKYGAKKSYVALFYLVDTDAKSDNWEPGNLYYIVANNKFADSYTQFLATLAKDAPEEVLKTLDPRQQGVLLTLQFSAGRDGQCSIGASFPHKVIEPIKLEEHVYVNIDQAYIKPGFSQEKYDALLNRYKEEYAKLSGNGVPEGAGETNIGESKEGDKPADPPPTGASGQSMIPQKDQKSEEQPNQPNQPEQQGEKTGGTAPWDGDKKEEGQQPQPSVEQNAGDAQPAPAATAPGGSVWDKFRK